MRQCVCGLFGGLCGAWVFMVQPLGNYWQRLSGSRGVAMLREDE